jgi:quinohemoprotein ethanol dehydrogenase
MRAASTLAADPPAPAGSRFSPLSKITPDNVGQLGPAWLADLETNRGQEATPLVIDGVMYISTAWSMVKAFDAKTGALLWSYDPSGRARGGRGLLGLR